MFLVSYHWYPESSNWLLITYANSEAHVSHAYLCSLARAVTVVLAHTYMELEAALDKELEFWPRWKAVAYATLEDSLTTIQLGFHCKFGISLVFSASYSPDSVSCLIEPNSMQQIIKICTHGVYLLNFSPNSNYCVHLQHQVHKCHFWFYITKKWIGTLFIM